MKFTVSEKKKHSEVEKDLIEYWKENGTFQKSIDQRPKENAWVFYDGPPFITGLPHHGTLLVSSMKDAFARYYAMQGKRVEGAWGWDCHGLPAEVKIDEKLGIRDSSEIGSRVSVEEYVKTCRAAMVQGGSEWDEIIDRIGRWVDMSKPYRTMDKEYMESVWWAFKTLYEKGKLYDGEKVLLYCTKQATPISKSEVAMENAYKTIADPSVFVYFKLADESKFRNTYLLAWTTTPWTLPANVAVAVNTKIKYVEVQYDGKRVVVAKELYEKVFTDEKHKPLDFKLVGAYDVRELVDQKYEPLFESHGSNAHRVLDASYVSDGEGSGIVHLAPAYGEEDFEFAKENNVPVVSNVDKNGIYTSGRWQSENIWLVNKEIAKTLVSEDKALKVEYIEHEYPHCHRCGERLMYRAHYSWFMDIQSQKDEMLAQNEESKWVPKVLKEKRFKNILLSAPDWNLSRDRFWATPIPVWKGQKEDGVEVVKVFGSYEEFEKFTGLSLEDYHLPMVMDVEFELEGVTMKHIGKVLDCWFESGSMPFAQHHYPFENKDYFESRFPADLVIEGVDQTRGWFSALMSVNVGLFGKAAYKNLVCNGFINAADGQKISKKLKNYTDPMTLLDNLSADAFRLFTLSSPLVNGEDANLADKDIETVERKLAMFSNTYDFFTMYASVDGWDSDSAYKDGELLAPDSENILDKWIVSRLQSLVKEVSDGMEEYQLNEATRGIIPFLDDLSNWYVRRSRRRFWKSENDGDKSAAYHTLYYVLVEFAKILAPFSPFISEDIYRKLTGEESVHLKDFPLHQPSLVNEKLEKEMKEVRESVREGLAQRARAGIKVRQPLTKVYLENIPSKEMIEVVKEELNVKEVGLGDELSLDLELTPELKKEGLMREVVRVIQSARKNAELNVDDRIKLRLSSDSDTLSNVVAEFKDVIADEVLASAWSDAALSYSETVKIEGEELSLSLEKA
jgi:isoleucyl-tRNA synthetase